MFNATMLFAARDLDFFTDVALRMGAEIFFGRSQKNWSVQPGGCFSRRNAQIISGVKILIQTQIAHF